MASAHKDHNDKHSKCFVSHTPEPHLMLIGRPSHLRLSECKVDHGRQSVTTSLLSLT